MRRSRMSLVRQLRPSRPLLLLSLTRSVRRLLRLRAARLRLRLLPLQLRRRLLPLLLCVPQRLMSLTPACWLMPLPPRLALLQQRQRPLRLWPMLGLRELRELRLILRRRLATSTTTRLSSRTMTMAKTRRGSSARRPMRSKRASEHLPRSSEPPRTWPCSMPPWPSSSASRSTPRSCARPAIALQQRPWCLPRSLWHLFGVGVCPTRRHRRPRRRAGATQRRPALLGRFRSLLGAACGLRQLPNGRAASHARARCCRRWRERQRRGHERSCGRGKLRWKIYTCTVPARDAMRRAGCGACRGVQRHR